MESHKEQSGNQIATRIDYGVLGSFAVQNVTM